MRRSLCTLSVSCLLLVTIACGSVLAERSDETAALPEVGTGAGTNLPVGGESIKFDDKGPTIVTEDGELRRIENWDKLTEKEKEVAWSRVRKRNLERVEKLRKDAYDVSQHDSTLEDLEGDSQRSIEDRYVQAQSHLAAFQASLSKLKDNAGGIPGFGGIEELLEDPTEAEKHKVDAAELRRKLQELQRSTEQLKKDKGLRHEEL